MIDQTIQKQAALAVALRHELHQIPELKYEEVKTAELLRHHLDQLGIQYAAGVENAPTATIGLIGDPSKPCVGLRADIDALPITEKTELPYQSRHPGKMHACGHDGHMSVLMGAAGVLKSIESQLNVCVKLIFQPAEEGGAGAQRLVEAGVLDGRIGPNVKTIFGLHGWPSLAVGEIGSRPGVMMAASDRFSATFTGKMCHASAPQNGVDPIIAACTAVTNLQQIVSREVSPVDSAVVTVAKIQGGTANNIIPESATISGTVRTLSESTRRAIQQAMDRRCRGIALANNCSAEFVWTDGYPMTINDPHWTEYVADIARAVVGKDQYCELPHPSLGGEDFAFYLQKIPGSFFRLGVRPVDQETYPSLHNDHFNFTDEALEVGIRMFVQLILNYPVR